MAKKIQNTESTLETKLAEISAKAQAKAESRLIKSLETEKGSNRYLKKQDNKILLNIVDEIESITGKKVMHGFVFDTNVELLIAIASSLQFMKKDFRELVPSTLYKIFDGDTRTEILDAYGRLPYLIEDTVLSVDGELVIVDPDAKERAMQGVAPEPQALEEVISDVAIELGLLAEYNCTQSQVDSAWTQALSKIKKQEQMQQYKDSLEEDQVA